MHFHVITSTSGERTEVPFTEAEEAAATPSLEEVRSSQLAALADKRWQVETGGTVVNGVPIRTDATSQAKIDGAVALFANDPEMTAIDFEAQPGLWVSIDAATMTAIGIAVGRHVQACFSRARALSDQVMAAPDVEGILAVDLETGWPGQ